MCPNRANIAINVQTDWAKCQNQVIHIDGMCNECGNCATFCPRDGAPYRDKLTLYWRQEDFENSGNNGFILLDKAANSFRVRLGDRIVEAAFDKTGICSGDIPAEVAEVIWVTYRDYRYLFVSKAA